MIQPLLESMSNGRWMSLGILSLTAGVFLYTFRMGVVKNEKRALIGGAILFVIQGVLGIVLGYCLNLIPLQYTTYGVKAQAVITSIDVESGKSLFEKMQYIYVVEYKIDGQPVTARLSTHDEEKGNVLQVGGAVEIIFLPDNPRDIVFADIPTNYGTSSLLLGVIACVFSICIVMKYKKEYV